MPNFLPNFDPISMGQGTGFDPIQMPMFQPMGGPGGMPGGMIDPNQIAMQTPPMLAPPTMSQKLIQAGLAMIAADKAGMGGVGSIAAGLATYNDQMSKYAEERRKETRERLAEYELLGRIRERHMTEMQTVKRQRMLDRLRKEKPEMADLIDLDPEAAAKVMAAQMGGPAPPIAGMAMDAQVANTLLTGDPGTPQYMAAYNIAKQRKIMPDGTIIEPDMSAYRVPTFTPAAAGGVTAAATGAPAYGDAGGVTVGTAKSQLEGFDVAEGAKPTEADAKTMKAINAAHDRLQQLFDEREKLLGDEPPLVGTKEALLLEQNFGKIAAEIKDLKQMGTYDTGVEQLARGIVGDPINRGFDPMSPVASTSKMFSQRKGGKAFAQESLKSARDWVTQTRESELKSRGYTPKKSATGGGGGPGGGKTYSQKDLEFTAKKHGMTVEQVKQRLGIQ